LLRCLPLTGHIHDNADNTTDLTSIAPLKLASTIDPTHRAVRQDNPVFQIKILYTISDRSIQIAANKPYVVGMNSCKNSLGILGRRIRKSKYLSSPMTHTDTGFYQIMIELAEMRS